MTNKEAIEELNTFKIGAKSERGKKALDMAIEALEQESVLDKIMTEINTPNRGSCDYYIVDRIEDIINKYRAESEVSE